MQTPSAAAATGTLPHVPAGGDLAARYRAVRAASEALCAPLEIEDYVVQPMEDASPAKWHLAHTSWFFETFVLQPYEPSYRPADPRYAYLFNSYYVQAGARHCRDQRGMVTRPTVRETYAYRAHVDDAMVSLLDRRSGQLPEGAAGRTVLGLHHEQQHQELLLTDIKYTFSRNPIRPVYRPDAAPLTGAAAPPLSWVPLRDGVDWIGHDGSGFCFDNELPRHRELLVPAELASRLTTCGEYAEFIADGGYRRPELWLSDGWGAAQAAGWQAPLYWEPVDGGGWSLFTLAGKRAVDVDEPVCHVSHYEADAYARWRGCRLPTEAEWELAARDQAVGGNLVESGRLHPDVAPRGGAGHGDFGQLFGDCWEWTMSPYGPYPGYRPAPGALGEYNGKFMSGQFVLRGGSCATPQTHLRASYRNFFHPDARWQFSGIRLARDVAGGAGE